MDKKTKLIKAAISIVVVALIFALLSGLLWGGDLRYQLAQRGSRDPLTREHRLEQASGTDGAFYAQVLAQRCPPAV